MTFKKKVVRNVVNAFGWKTNRKIIVFESDDWGSIRMASKNAYNYFLTKGYKVDECVYNRNDSLESNTDMEGLFEVLDKFRDKNENPPTFTFNMLVANPDFERIKAVKHEKYYYEPFAKTLERYPNHSNVFSLYKYGIANKLIYPQFHGREHINIPNWLDALKNKNKQALMAFDNGMFTVHANGIPNGAKEYLDAVGNKNERGAEPIKDILRSGIKIFEEIWNYKPKSFIAPNYIWSNEVEEYLYQDSILYLQGLHVQKVPIDTKYGFKKKYNYTGKKNRNGQLYLVRNTFFEPSFAHSKDWVGDCLLDIKNAFFWKKPAIISTHRVNYIGSINENNRSGNLKLLEQLIKLIIEIYPDVEFFTSDQLGKLMDN